jgi:RNA polymerase sigma factor for flagellar operon FliA
VTEQVLEAVWQRFHAGERAARDELVHAYQPYARMHAARLYARRTYQDLEFDDYLQYAQLGLLEAIERYQDSHGAKFETFASARVSGAILNGIVSASELREQLAARKRIVAQRVEVLGGASARDDVFSQLAELAIGLALGFVLEETGIYAGAEGEYADNSYHGVELRQLRGTLLAALDRLPPLQRRIVYAHYLQQQPFAEVALACQLSAGRVAQLHKEAMAELRRTLHGQGGLDISL